MSLMLAQRWAIRSDPPRGGWPKHSKLRDGSRVYGSSWLEGIWKYYHLSLSREMMMKILHRRARDIALYPPISTLGKTDPPFVPNGHPTDAAGDSL